MTTKTTRIIRTSTIPLSLKILLKGQLKYLNTYFDIIGISSPGKDLEVTATREGIETFAIKMERKISPLKDLYSIFKMTYIFIKLKPTIVHSITSKAGLVSMVAAKIVGVPIRMHTFTGLIFPTARGFKKVVLKNIDRFVCFCATDIFPEGNGIKKDLIENKITTKKLEIIGNGNVNGIDIDFFSPKLYLIDESEKLKTNLSIKQEDFVFLFIGRLVQDKGIVELLDSFENIQTYNTHAHLIIAGEFEKYFKKFNITIKERLKNMKNAHWLGFIDDVRPLLCASNVLVLPSYREGFPNVLLQAGAMEVPCIVTDINGSNEIIIPEYNGIIVPPKNKEKLHSEMKRILFDKELHEKLKSNIRQSIITRYDQQILWNKIKKKYEEGLKNRGLI